MDSRQLVAGVRAGDRRALARAISLVESRVRTALRASSSRSCYPQTGSAFVVGITGPPGVGKSSLIGALIGTFARSSLTVGVVSIDPSSPFTHGALLGDRIRLSDHFLDPGVFIRSMGARGHLGGLAETTLQSLLLLDAAGTDVVFLETVGAGQSEVEVMSVADEVVLVLMPGSGDSVQALKAGIMEIPDVIAVNKMDQPGAKALQNDIRGVIALDPNAAWQPSDRPHGGPSRRGRRQAVERDHRAPGRARRRRRAGAAPARNLAGEVVGSGDRTGSCRNRARDRRGRVARRARSPRCSAARSTR